MQNDMGMDVVDEKQQREIDALKIIDKTHDTQFSLLTKLYIGMFVIVLALFVGGVIMTPMLMMSDGSNCPHTDCIHHRK